MPNQLKIILAILDYLTAFVNISFAVGSKFMSRTSRIRCGLYLAVFLPKIDSSQYS